VKIKMSGYKRNPGKPVAKGAKGSGNSLI
jgi:hypothetical protein